ncbi:MAG: S1 RNA-binding domain-containing protein [Firmicutes bacterium]|nr:S1 RNA-binding domain-containing protein [Bacillota bacterium]
MSEKREFFQDVWPEVYSSRQNRKILKWMVTGVNSYKIRDGEEEVPCLIVSKEQVMGIIPLTEAGVKIDERPVVNKSRLIRYIGQETPFVVIGIDTRNDRFIASRRIALQTMAAQTWPTLKEGMTVTVVARRVYDNSVVVEFNGIEAYLPIYEISYGWVEEILELIQPGDVFDVKIKELDAEKERVVVSLKDVIPNPWPGASKRYQRKGVYSGVVTGVTRYGIFVALEPGVNALCRHMKTDRFKVDKGDVVAVVVNSVKQEGGEGRINGGVIRVIRKNRAAS